MGFKERLKEARERKGYTQADMARKLQMSAYQSYRKYETGERAPGFDMAVMFADVLDVSLDWLAGLSSNREIHDRIPLENKQTE